MRRGVFVTGTDTGVGKTFAACALVHALRSAGARPMPMKPIAAGAIESAGRLVNEDTRQLLAAAGLDAGWTDAVTPILLTEPMAPHIAARREGRRITLDPVRAALARLEPAGDFLVVEGVGGFHVPLDDALDTIDLARLVNLPVVMVVGMRLGCLNHALLTAAAVRHSGLELAGWIANRIDPDMLVPEENIEALAARLDAPRVGTLPRFETPDARAAAACLDVRALAGAAPIRRP